MASVTKPLVPGVPRKVLAKARQLGVHNDCLAAGREGSCMPCREILIQAFDVFYGEIEGAGNVTRAILMDLFDEEHFDD